MDIFRLSLAVQVDKVIFAGGRGTGKGVYDISYLKSVKRPTYRVLGLQSFLTERCSIVARGPPRVDVRKVGQGKPAAYANSLQRPCR